MQLTAASITAWSLCACASLPAGRQADPSDPFERYNRAAFSFNDGFDRAILKPVAVAYKAVTPDLVQRGVDSFFGNLSDVPTALNDALQGKAKLAAVHIGRFALNSTFGLLGLFDVATSAGPRREREDFGQTLGHWGVDAGPYVVLPLLGPSSVRDSFGAAIDIAIDPVTHVQSSDWRAGLAALRVVERRASVLQIEKTFKTIELDPYLFTRDAYLARRRSAVFDGDPPDRDVAPRPPARSASDAPSSSEDSQGTAP